MKTIVMTILVLLNMACAKNTDSAPIATIAVEDEVQMELPSKFTSTLNYKEVLVNIDNVYTSCLPAGCQLGGIGKDTIVIYNHKTCFFNTELLTNYRTNYYFLTIKPRVEDIANYNYQPNPSECSELLGNFWVHHTSQVGLFNSTFEMAE
jgi:hypothetical protein